MNDGTIQRVAVQYELPRLSGEARTDGAPTKTVAIPPPQTRGETSDISAAARKAERAPSAKSEGAAQEIQPPPPPASPPVVQNPTDVALRASGSIVTGATVQRGAGGALVMEMPPNAAGAPPGGATPPMSDDQRFAWDAQSNLANQARSIQGPMSADSKTPLTDMAVRTKQANDDMQQAMMIYTSMAADRVKRGGHLPSVRELRLGYQLPGSGRSVQQGSEQAPPLPPRADGKPHTLTEVAAHAFKTDGAIPPDYMTMIADASRAFAGQPRPAAAQPPPSGPAQHPNGSSSVPEYGTAESRTPLTDIAQRHQAMNDDMQRAQQIYFGMARERQDLLGGLYDILGSGATKT